MTLAPLLAFHWRHAAEDRELDPDAALKAAEYYGRAANHAMHLHALKEAIDDWQQALALLDRLPQSAARDSLELKLLLELGPAEVAAGSYSAPEVEAVFDRARALGEAAGEHGLLFRALRGQWQVRIGRGEYRKAMALANELLVLAERADDPAAMLEAWRCKGTTAFWTAEFDEACSALSRSIETYGETAHRDLVSIYGQDPKVAAMGLLAWTLAHLGFDGEARACAEKARAWAEDLKPPVQHRLRLRCDDVDRLFSRRPGLRSDRGAALHRPRSGARLSLFCRCRPGRPRLGEPRSRELG